MTAGDTQEATMKCPGQDTRYWKHDAIFDVPCPNCGQMLEFFKDQTTIRCKGCGKQIINPKMDFGCASYCQYAEQCLGELPPELLAKRDDLLKDRVAIQIKNYLKKDFKRIGHTTKVARYAGKIVQPEGGVPAIVLCAAYLLDIGTKEAEQKYGDTSNAHLEAEGPAVARKMLTNLKAKESIIDEVCDIIGHRQPQAEETVNYKCVYDAEQLVKLMEAKKEEQLATEALEALIDKNMMTETGRQLAKTILLADK